MGFAAGGGFGGFELAVGVWLLLSVGDWRGDSAGEARGAGLVSAQSEAVEEAGAVGEVFLYVLKSLPLPPYVAGQRGRGARNER